MGQKYHLEGTYQCNINLRNWQNKLPSWNLFLFIDKILDLVLKRVDEKQGCSQNNENT